MEVHSTQLPAQPMVLRAARALDGNPMAVFRDDANEAGFAHCVSPYCNAADVTNFVPHNPLAADTVDLVASSEGLPLIVSVSSSAADVITVIECTNVKCDDLPGRPLLKRTVAAAGATAAALAVPSDAKPVIAYVDGSGLKFMKCSTDTCDEDVTQQGSVAVSVSGGVRGDANSAGKPFFTFVAADGKAKVYLCDDEDCSAGTLVNSGVDADVVVDVGSTPAGHPAVLARGTGGMTAFMCTSATCAEVDTIAVNGATSVGAMAFGADDNLLVVASNSTGLQAYHVDLQTTVMSVTQLAEGPGVGGAVSITHDQYNLPLIFYSDAGKVRFMRCSLETCASTVPEAEESE